MMGFEGKRHRLKEAFCIRHGLVMLPARVRVRGRENLTCPSGPSLTTCLLEPKSGSYPVVGKPDVGFGGPMMGAMRSLM
jgi:hypothetical protein